MVITKTPGLLGTKLPPFCKQRSSKGDISSGESFFSPHRCVTCHVFLQADVNISADRACPFTRLCRTCNVLWIVCCMKGNSDPFIKKWSPRASNKMVMSFLNN